MGPGKSRTFVSELIETDTEAAPAASQIHSLITNYLIGEQKRDGCGGGRKTATSDPLPFR